MKRVFSVGRILGLVTAIFVALVAQIGAHAASSNYLDVCTTGCTYSDVQSAINAITNSSATNVYTIFIDSGVLSTSTSITTNGKSYINFEGRGIGVSVVQATATWFQNCGGTA